MNNFKIGVIKTSWYEDQIQIMVDTITSVQGPVYEIKKVPGSLELAAGGKAFLEQGPDALIFCGIVIRGETSHYDLVTSETFRSIGSLALEVPYVPMINNVICVENKDQLDERIEKNTSSNIQALLSLLKGS